MPQGTKKEFIIVIPARYNSSRFPGKPLVNILGKSMLQRVWLTCTKVLPPSDVFIATDDKRIAEHCQLHDMQYLITSKRCLTGTDRVIEVSKKIKSKFYINVQGDEPLVNKNDIKKLIKESQKNPNFIMNAMTKITSKSDYLNSSVPKVVFSKEMELLYMSRSHIPGAKKKLFSDGYRQVCIYSFPSKIISNLKLYNKKTPLESIEDIEILRFLEYGIKIKMVKSSPYSIAVDFPSDLELVKKKLNEKE